MPTIFLNALRGTSGNDILSPGNGAQTLLWAPTMGIDVYHGGDTGENYDSNPYFDKTGGDRLVLDGRVGVNVRFTTTENGHVNNGRLTFTGIERIHLTDGNDTLNGASAQITGAHGGTPVHGLTVYAGLGNDSIVGTRAADWIDGGAGNDTIRAGDGWDVVQSSTGNDLIYGGGGNDNIRWGQGNPDEVVGNDTIYGGEGGEEGGDLLNIWIKDWEGNGVEVNFITNENGRAWTDIGGAHSTLRFVAFENFFTHEGRDTVSAANAVIGADHEGIHFNTRWGDDILIGSRGNDRLEGGEGADTIEGGAGNDLISASEDYYRMDAPADADADVLIFHRGFGHDTVLAFDSDLDTLKLDSGMSYRAVETNNGTLLTFQGGDTILLAQVFDFI